LENAKTFFVNELQKRSKAEIEEIYRKITQNFMFNTYEISSDIDVFVTFETMNNRGKPLTYLELLKNRLIYLSALFVNIDEDIKERLRRDINECWKTIYHILGKNKKKQLPDDEFLAAHYHLYFCKDIKKMEEDDPYFSYRYYNEFGYQHLLDNYFLAEKVLDDSLTVEFVFDYIESLKNTIQTWNYVNNPSFANYNDEIKEYMNKINNLINEKIGYRRFSNIKVFMLACLERNEKELTLLKFLKALEKYLFLITFIPDEFLEEIELFKFKETLMKLHDGDITLTGLREKLSKINETILEDEEINTKIIKYYSKRGFYGSEFLKYFLCEYEMHLFKTSRTNIKKLARDEFFEKGHNSIEHIYPQNARQKYWTNMYSTFNHKQKENLRNSLGNFVVLSREKNSKLSNLPFPEKKENRHNTVGYKYGTYAELELLKYEDWGGMEILERGNKLIDFLYQRWGFKIGNGTKEKKAEFLGLLFLMQK